MILRIIAFLLALTLGAAAQVGQIPSWPPLQFVASGGGNDPATTAWVSQVVTRGGTVSGTQTTNINNLVVCLKTGGTNLFAISDKLYLLASENTAQATTDLITPSATQAVASGATFNAVGGTAPFGYSGNGTTTFFDTSWAPSTGPNFTLNSATWMVYDGTSTATASRFGSEAVGATSRDELRFTGATSAIAYINDTTSTGSGTLTNSKGIFIGTRTSTTNVILYYNGVNNATNSTASVALSTFNFYAAGGVNSGGSLANANTDVIGAMGSLAGLNPTQITQYNGCIQTYLTAWGA